MTRLNTTVLSLLLATASFAQEEEKKAPDTTRVNLRNLELIIVEKHKDEEDSLNLEDGFENDETEHYKHEKSEAHWAGVDFGFSILMNSEFDNSFPDHKYWENDPSRSQTWNLNIFEHKFQIAKQYFGITTGLGFNFTSVAFKDNYLLRSSADSIYAEMDTVFTYTKNKLKATYLTVPFLLEFNTSMDEDKSFYLAAGVVGGVRISSKTKRVGEFDGNEFTQKDKGIYNLNPFKADAHVRLGYGDWGAFASYSLLPLFEEAKTTEVYPLTFGLSLNF